MAKGSPAGWGKSGTINDIYPWGRSFQEYRDMFALSDHDLAMGLRLLRNVRHVRVDGLGHPLHAIQPARMAELFEAFLTGDQAANCSLADVVRARGFVEAVALAAIAGKERVDPPYL